jgi:hypothetical protein
MATESPLLHDGSQTVLSTTNDARRSSISGTTLLGPNGSGQFLGVVMSTVARTVLLISSTGGVSGSTLNQPYYGILQNAPGPGGAADIGFFGISKVVAGLATITQGNLLQFSSTAAGVVTPYLGGNGRAIGFAVEAAATVGAVFTAALYGFANFGGST